MTFDCNQQRQRKTKQHCHCNYRLSVFFVFALRSYEAGGAHEAEMEIKPPINTDAPTSESKQ